MYIKLFSYSQALYPLLRPLSLYIYILLAYLFRFTCENDMNWYTWHIKGQMGQYLEYFF